MNETETIRERVKSGLPQWKCHKVVRAAPIRTVYRAEVTNEMEDTSIEARPWVIYLDSGPNPNGFHSPIYVKPETFSRYVPQPGDYFVVYDDGYESVSPRKAFQEGYSQVQVQEV